MNFNKITIVSGVSSTEGENDRNAIFENVPTVIRHDVTADLDLRDNVYLFLGAP